MTVALIAHDKRKDSMVDFCIAYSGVLSEHRLCATSNTKRAICKETKLKIESHSSGRQGGLEQIIARIVHNEIDLVLFFRDPDDLTPHQTDMDVFRQCDKIRIPLATNLASAELLINGLRRGDLDWRIPFSHTVK